MKKIAMTLCLLISNQLFAAGGFEKPSLWSAESSGSAGVMASKTKGAQALFFNPAGLNAETNQLSIQTSIIGGHTSGPISTNNEKQQGSDDLFPIGGILGSVNITEKFAIGYGVYGLAGLDTKFPSYNYGKVNPEYNNYSVDYYSSLSVMEYSIGSSYKLNKNISFGAAIRAQSVSGAFRQSSLTVSDGSFGIPEGTDLYVSSVELKDLKTNKAGSYKLGLQVANDDQTMGLGVSYRSEVQFTAKGSSSGDQMYTNTGSAFIAGATGGTVTPTAGQKYSLDGSAASVSTVLPQQLVIDTHMQLSENSILLVGYSWTDYSKAKELKTSATVTDSTLTNTNTQVPSTQLNWKDMHDLKFGYLYNWSSSLQLRSGFVYTSKVTNQKDSSPTYCPPGSTKQVSAGFGKAVNLLGQS